MFLWYKFMSNSQQILYFIHEYFQNKLENYENLSITDGYVSWGLSLVSSMRLHGTNTIWVDEIKVVKS